MDFDSYRDIKNNLNIKNSEINNLINLDYHSKNGFLKHPYVPRYDSSIFCHYRGEKGADSIINTCKLRLGAIENMNDNEELKYTKDLAKKCLRNLFPQNEKLFSGNKLYNKFDSIMSLAPKDYYILSGSENDHSQALQNYGHFSFKFNKNELYKSLDDYRKKYNINHKELFLKPYFVKVIYDEETQKNILNKLIKTLVTALRVNDEIIFKAQKDPIKKSELEKNKREADPILKLLINKNKYNVPTQQSNDFEIMLKNINSFNEQIINNKDYNISDKIVNDCAKAIIFCSTYFKRSILYQEEEERLVIGTNNLGDYKVMRGSYFELPFYSKGLLEFIYTIGEVDKRPHYEALLRNNNFHNVKILQNKLPY